MVSPCLSTRWGQTIEYEGVFNRRLGKIRNRNARTAAPAITTKVALKIKSHFSVFRRIKYHTGSHFDVTQETLRTQFDGAQVLLPASFPFASVRRW